MKKNLFSHLFFSIIKRNRILKEEKLMIDEEDDDEEILEKGWSYKSVLKNIVVILIIILGVFFIYWGITPDQITNFFIGFMLVCFGTTLLQVKKQPTEPIRQTLSILTCALCGVTKVRNFQQGDFVYKRVDSCSQCNEPLEIKKIYSVKLKKGTVEPKKSTTPSTSKKK